MISEKQSPYTEVRDMISEKQSAYNEVRKIR